MLDPISANLSDGLPNYRIGYEGYGVQLQSPPGMEDRQIQGTVVRYFGTVLDLNRPVESYIFTISKDSGVIKQASDRWKFGPRLPIY